ncbi:hypothetical protein AAG906_003452 [Vitis piasezkii]
MAELGHQTVEFSTLVSRAAEESFLSLKDLVEKSKSSDQSDSEKKISLLKFIVKTQQRMLRLNVLAKWCQQVPLIQYCQQLASTLSSHDTCFTQAQARAPIYDVPSAVEVLLTGTYERLPKCVEDVGVQGTLTGDQQKAALKKLDTLVRSKLLEVSLPKEISEVKVSDGTALLCVDGEFKVLVTLGYRGHLSMWRILHLELLVGERGGLVKLEELRRHALGDDLERGMAAAENPFMMLYSVLHELCVALIMDTVIRQVKALRQGRWKDAIRFELISDGNIAQGGSAGSMQTNQDGEADSAGLRTPGLKIVYWLDLDKNSGTSDSGSCPFIKVEPGPDLQIKCLHSTFVIDPLTGKEAEFSLDQNCIDVEKLLLRAICCSRYTRLLEIQKELAKNSQICRTMGDVLLHCHADESEVDNKKKDIKSNARECEGQEVLRSNGRFLLQSSRNILTPSTLSDCEEALNQGSMTAAEVFISLRSKSILHLFASIGSFLGLEVYEHGFAAVKLPKHILNGSNLLLMGFPDCGRFQALFKLLETQPDPSGKSSSFGDMNHVIRIKKIDIGQMQMFEDELNLSLVDWGKLLSFLPNAGVPNQTSEHGLLSEFSLESSMHNPGCPPSSFSSIVDEVFELEKGASLPPFSVPNLSSSYSSPGSHFAGASSPKWEGGMQISQINTTKVSSVAPHYGGSLYSSGNMKGSMQSSSVSLQSSAPVRSAAGKKLSASKSDQDLASLRSPHSLEIGSGTTMDEDHLRLLSDSSKEAVSGSRSSRLLSPPRPTGPRVPASSSKPNGPRSSPTGPLPGSLRAAGSSSWVTSPTSQAPDSANFHGSSHDVVSKQDIHSRKRSVSDMLDLIPSLQNLEANTRFYKRRKISESAHTLQPLSQALISSEIACKTEGYSYGNLIAEANKGNAPSSVYVSALLHVVRHSSLCIKHARLTSQMEALDIPYVEEVGLRNASSNLWFRLPFSSGDSWQHICLRLGRPGSMYWDVKIIDQHFRDLWELQKGSSNTTWGSGVRIANTSDIDSHIRYDPEGVVLSYQSVEADSIKKLVADIQRLSNARMFALGMRKLLGVRMDEKPEEISANCDGKVPVGVKMRRAFRIEAVGLMSLWFSFGSGVLARFVVEWESGKEGCTMHVSPDQLWPHTKFLEDFINGAEVASLLDCIRLTAGPLHALAAATRPARAGPAAGVPGVTAANSSIPKQSGYIPSQGLLPSSSTTNVSQATSGPGVTPPASAASGPLGNHSLHGAAMLAAAGEVVLALFLALCCPLMSQLFLGPYWIRIIYRKYFAVDMRNTTKGGPSVGGSLPCPQFRPFIMEHVAQELNGLEPNFAGGQQTIGLANSNNPNPSSGSQLSAANGNRVGLPNSAGISRPGNQTTGMNRVGSALSASQNLAMVNSGLPLRRSPGQVSLHMVWGGWVPLVALKKVLRGILKYLGVLWLFAQLPDLLKEILGSILKDNEGALLNLDQEQPALRFLGYVFAVSVHRVQLLLQVLSVKRFHHQQQPQQQPNSATAQEELTQSEIGEICDYFSRRVASEPYDASRVASFITLLTLPISVLREFLKLIAWKRIGPGTRCNIHYDRSHNSVDFGLTVVLDPAHIPHINAAGGAAWLPYCVSVRLRYSFGENSTVSFLGMEGSHGGRACWLRIDDWEKCKHRVVRTVEVSGCSPGDMSQGRLKIVADNVQRALHVNLQGLRDGSGVASNSGAT